MVFTREDAARAAQNIGIDFNRLFDEFLVGNLCAHVDSFDHVIAFKSVMALSLIHI